MNKLKLFFLGFCLACTLPVFAQQGQKIEFPSAAFNGSSAKLQNDVKSYLNERVVKVLLNNKNIHIKIIGHCTGGSAAGKAQRQLSYDRAVAVRNYLISQKIDEKRIALFHGDDGDPNTVYIEQQ